MVNLTYFETFLITGFLFVFIMWFVFDQYRIRNKYKSSRKNPHSHTWENVQKVRKLMKDNKPGGDVNIPRRPFLNSNGCPVRNTVKKMKVL